MLTLDDVTIHLQDFGTIVCIHLVGATKKAIEERYFSFYNHETTGGELDWENDVRVPYHAFFWVYSGKKGTAQEKVKMGLIRAARDLMLPPNAPNKATKGRDIWPEAINQGQAWFNSIDHVTWLDMRAEVEIYNFGDAVVAEKGTGNFDDEVLARVVTRGGNTSLEMLQAMHSEGEEPESFGKNEEVPVGAARSPRDYEKQESLC